MISCKICGNTYTTIPWSHLHYRHNMTPAEYKRKFKVQFIHSVETRHKIGRHLFGHAVTDREPTPAERKEFHAWLKWLWKQPRLRKKLGKIRLASWKDDERIKKLSERMKKQWADHEYRAKVSEAIKEITNCPGAVAYRSRVSKKLWKEPAYRKKMARRKHPPGPVSRLNESQWQEVISWLKENPQKLGVQAIRLNVLHLTDLIRTKWDEVFEPRTVHYHLVKRGCRIVPIGPREKPDFSSASLRYHKWVPPTA
jgi:hypothetical protein